MRAGREEKLKKQEVRGVFLGNMTFVRFARFSFFPSFSLILMDFSTLEMQLGEIQIIN